MTKNAEVKWVETKGNENMSIKPLSFLGDIWCPMWGRDRGSEFHKIQRGPERAWNYMCLTIEFG